MHGLSGITTAMFNPRESPRYLADMALEADDAAPAKLWYLSFVDGKFLGALLMKGRSFSGVLTASHLRGLNPGGEIQFHEVPEQAAVLIDPKWLDRLLSREDLNAMDTEMATALHHAAHGSN